MAEVTGQRSRELVSYRLKRINGEDYARYKLIARATYLPKGRLVVATTYLRFAPVRRLGSARECKG